MHDPLDDVLRLVAEGRLSPEEAAPIIDALAAAREAASQARAAGSATRDAGTSAADAARAAADAARAAFACRRPDRQAAGAPRRPGTPRPPVPPGPPRRLRVQVRDDGRTVVDLQLPGLLAELAGSVPGMPAAYVERVREALRTGFRGPIVDVTDDDGSGITITVD